jgi:hypothetical protein
VRSVNIATARVRRLPPLVSAPPAAHISNCLDEYLPVGAVSLRARFCLYRWNVYFEKYASSSASTCTGS